MGKIQDTLFSILADKKGSTFLCITARTDARCKKPYKNIKKVSKVVINVGFDYERGVNRRRDNEGKEADFEVGSSWHVPFLVDGKLTPFCQHKTTGELYLRCQHIQTIGEPVYLDENGIEYSKEQLAEFLPKPSEYKRQQLDAPLKFLTYAVESILEVSVSGSEHVLGV